jgi:hypothetical protein
MSAYNVNSDGYTKRNPECKCYAEDVAEPVYCESLRTWDTNFLGII